MGTHLRLVNRLHEVIVANLTAIEIWGFYLTSPEFSKELELRNKLGVIWICSLIDTVEAEMRFLPEVEKEATEHGFLNVAKNAARLQKLCKIVGEVLALYNPHEQLFMTTLRNQWVHSYLANRHKVSVNIKYFENGSIVSASMDNESYHSAIRPFFESNEHRLDITLRDLVERSLLNTTLRYWNVIGILQARKEEIYRAMRDDRLIEDLLQDC